MAVPGWDSEHRMDCRMSKLTYEEERELRAVMLAREAAMAELERQAAYKAVAAALASYRAWGWTNIVNTVRLWIQSLRWTKSLRSDQRSLRRK